MGHAIFFLMGVNILQDSEMHITIHSDNRLNALSLFIIDRQRRNNLPHTWMNLNLNR